MLCFGIFPFDIFPFDIFPYGKGACVAVSEHARALI